MTGHAEVHSHVMNEFQAKVFPESVVYQVKNVPGEELGKNENFGEIGSLLAAGNGLGKVLRSRYFEGAQASNKVPALPSTLAAADQAERQTPQMLILEAKKCFKNKAYAEAIDKAKQAIDLQDRNFEADYLLAQIYANLGKYSQAIEHCKRASKADAMSVFPNYLQAHIAEEQGDLETAKTFLKKTIYLSPSFVSAYLELGNIYNKEGKVNIAIKMYKTSCDFLQKLPPNTSIELQGEMTASQLLMDVKKKLVNLYSKHN